ncbi:MAG TPA: alpha/beta hydrolase [Candidatus Krumholzibacteria bacterium]|nr:alpha/beta hydrolase [Candidatus Krumholzibacteria bacterium]
MTTRPPRLSLTPATFRDTEAERGRLRVPVVHGAPDGPGMELRFVRLKSLASRPGAPLVFLTGGPGLSGIRSAQGRLFPMFDAARQHADVILLDQRACVADELVPRPDHGVLSSGRALTRDDYVSVIKNSVCDGVQALRAAGIPVDALNTEESADDVAMLVRQLYGENARMALFGWSYGSHLAMSIIRRHPSLVEAAVLAAPEGPDHTFKRPLRVQEHLERLAQRSSCDVTGMIDRALHRLQREPARVTVRWEEGMEAVELVLGRFELEWILSEGVPDTRVMKALPASLSRMERGDFQVVGDDRLLRGAWRALREELLSSVVRYAMDCASGATAARRRLIDAEAKATLLGNTIDFPCPDVCDALGCPDLGDEFRGPLHGDMPVLFITGTLDCRTPAENVAELAPGFPSHRHLVVEDAGHSDLLLPGAVHEQVAHFLATTELLLLRVRAETPLVFDPPARM